MVILSVIIKINGQLMLYDSFVYQVVEEMESHGIQLKHRTFFALLKSCGTAGHVDEVYDVPPPKRCVAWLCHALRS
jgi:hypothetical protein